MSCISDFDLDFYRSSSRKILRNHFENGVLSLGALSRVFVDWSLQRDFFILRTMVRLDSFRYRGSCVSKDRFLAIPCVKRGDFNYSEALLKVFYDLDMNKKFRDVVYFKRLSSKDLEGNSFFVTLEYDANRFRDFDSWKRNGVDFNRFMSSIRQKFGTVDFIRVFESQESGMCHIHGILIFRDYLFIGKIINGKRRIVDSDYSFLKNAWSHGYSDFKLVDSFRGGLRYITKYLSKSCSVDSCGKKGLYSLSLAWLYGKRSFSISSSLRGDVIRPYINSSIKDKIKDDFGFFYDRCTGWDIDGWVFVGFLKNFWSSSRFHSFVFDSSNLFVKEIRHVRIKIKHFVYEESGSFDYTCKWKEIFEFGFRSRKKVVGVPLLSCC